MDQNRIPKSRVLQAYSFIESRETVVWFAKNDRDNAEVTMFGLREALPIISGYFELQSPLPRITAVLVPSRAEYDLLVVNLLGVNTEVPSRPERIAQPQRTDLVLLSPSAYEKYSAFRFSHESYRRLLAHELVHIVEEHLSPDIEALPLWWSEGLAVYLSGQWRWEEDFSQPVVDGVNAGRVPQLSRIEKDRTLGYQWGWTMVQYIEKIYGKEAILRIVAQCKSGDVFAVLCTKKKPFERQWKAALLRRGKDL